MKFGGLLEKLLNQVDVGHQHATAAVTLATQAVHGLTVPSVSTAFCLSVGGLFHNGVPIAESLILDHLDKSLPEVAGDPTTREATNGNDHSVGVVRLFVLVIAILAVVRDGALREWQSLNILRVLTVVMVCGFCQQGLDQVPKLRAEKSVAKGCREVKVAFQIFVATAHDWTVLSTISNQPHYNFLMLPKFLSPVGCNWRRACAELGAV